MKCPLFIAAGKKPSECECIREECGFWSEMRDAEDEEAWVEGCAIRLIPRAVDSVKQSALVTEEALIGIEAVTKEIRNVWTAVALAAGQSLSVDVDEVLHIAQSLYPEPAEDGDGEEDEAEAEAES